MNERKVAIDARMVEMSGIGVYIQHILGQGLYDVAIGNSEIIRKYDTEIEVIEFESSIYGVKGQLRFPVAKLKKLGVTMVHFPHYNVPLVFPIPYVVTVHDLTHMVYPEFLNSKVKYLYAKMLLSHACKKAYHIFTVSQCSKKDIQSFFKIEESKISLTYNAVDKSFGVKTKEEFDYLYEKYKIPKEKKILLYVGNLKPHKNLARLLVAFSRLDRDKFFLVLVGKAFKKQIDLQQTEEKLGIENCVCHTGVISKDELVDIYNLADLFIFPSLYEGFGVPPLEAMACGTPVVASNTSSIPEVVGDAAVLFDPYNVDQMVDCIKEIMEDEKKQKELIERGNERIKKFFWNKAVETIRKVMDL